MSFAQLSKSYAHTIIAAMTDLKKLWDSALVQIELTVSPATYAMWFKDTSIISFEDGVVKLGVPNTFVKEWLSNKFHTIILRLLRDLSDCAHSLEYNIVQPKPFSFEKEVVSTKNESTESLPLGQPINKEDNLNPRYTFESFIIGPFNELAHAAAQAIIKKPVAYNPLFIYGNTGLGKTHLMQAVGNHFKHSSSQKRVFYITSEKFTQEMTNALQASKMNSFKEKYRKYDVFIMDDIQFLSNKEKTQEELFHLFNHLYENNKQIIFSSDKHPNFIPNLEARLRSRFVAGMIIDVPQPDHESRVAIIRKKAEAASLHLSEETINLLASNVVGNIREIEGIINSICVQKELKGKEISLVDIKNLIKTTAQPQKSVSVKELVKTIADFYGVEETSIIDKNRKKEVVRPRQVAMYIMREFLNISYPSIGQKLGGRDHTTVMHACEKLKKELETDGTLAEEIAQLKSMF